MGKAGFHNRRWYKKDDNHAIVYNIKSGRWCLMSPYKLAPKDDVSFGKVHQRTARAGRTLYRVDNCGDYRVPPTDGLYVHYGDSAVGGKTSWGGRLKHTVTPTDLQQVVMQMNAEDSVEDSVEESKKKPQGVQGGAEKKVQPMQDIVVSGAIEEKAD